MNRLALAPVCQAVGALLALTLPALATAQPQTAGTPASPVVVNGVTINGPAPPVEPETLARDAQGRVTLRAVRTSEPFKVDGRLDEEVYRAARPISGFIQTDPSPGAAATERTEVWIAFDDKNIYVGAKCYDSSPESQWVANEMRRDNRGIFRNENVAISFDTFFDRRNAFLFEVTPIGGIYDATVVNEQPGGNPDYNPVWDHEVGRFDGGWTAEMAIPFRALRYKPGTAQVWGVNIRRTVRWKNEESFVQLMPPNQGSVIFQISLAGTLVGIDAPSGSKNVEIKPYAIAGTTSDFRAKPPISNDGSGDVGVDVKYGLTQNLTADFTYNTDFAQVEVDEQQVNLTRFPLFFPEKREFFLEGQGIFDFGGSTSTTNGNGGSLAPLLFFSRRIGLNQGRAVPIDVGGRLTGKVGKVTVGVVDVRTAEDGLANAPATNFSVVRVKRDILRRSSVGVLLTDRSVSSSGGAGSGAYGVDTSIGLFNNLTMNAYLAKTPSTAGTDDLSYRTVVNYNGDRYGVQAERLVVGNDFNPDLGFLRRDDFERSFGSFRFSPRPKRSKRIRKYSYTANYDYIANREGRLETRDVNTQFAIQFQNTDQLSVATGRSYELLEQPFAIAPGVRIPVGGYGFQDGAVQMSFGNQRKVSGAVAVSGGQFYDGHRVSLTYSGGRIELSPRFSLEPSYSLNHVTLSVGDFTTNLLSNRATFTVTPRMFFSGLAQYNSSARSVSSNFRLRWEYRPGSEFFVVYTDERDTLTRGLPDVKNRAFVVKINRLFQF